MEDPLFECVITKHLDIDITTGLMNELDDEELSFVLAKALTHNCKVGSLERKGIFFNLFIFYFYFLFYFLLWNIIF
jgi:Zn-dependent protease with chaperone function